MHLLHIRIDFQMRRHLCNRPIPTSQVRLCPHLPFHIALTFASSIFVHFISFGTPHIISHMFRKKIEWPAYCPALQRNFLLLFLHHFQMINARFLYALCKQKYIFILLFSRKNSIVCQKCFQSAINKIRIRYLIANEN